MSRVHRRHHHAHRRLRRRLAHSSGAHSAALDGHEEWGASAHLSSAAGRFTPRATHLRAKILASGNQVSVSTGVAAEALMAARSFTAIYAKALRDTGRLQSSLVLRQASEGEDSTLDIIRAGMP